MQQGTSFNLSEKFVRTITGAFGEKGRQWLVDLPEIVEEIAADWSLNVGKAFANLSYHYVAECVCADGGLAVLKIGCPAEGLEFINEVKMLRLFAGEGAVRLLRIGENRCTMLLEKLTPGEHLGNLCLKDDKAGVETAIDVLRKIIRKPLTENGFHLLDNWIGGFRKAKNTEFPAAAVKKARDLFDELSGAGSQNFLLHGDFHHENILSAEREPFLVIDPKGLIGGTGYDIGVFLNNHRNWLDGSPDMQAKLEHSVRKFGDAFGIEPEDVRKWAFVQMVLSAWWTFEENEKSWKSELSKAEIWQV